MFLMLLLLVDGSYIPAGSFGNPSSTGGPTPEPPIQSPADSTKVGLSIQASVTAITAGAGTVSEEAAVVISAVPALTSCALNDSQTIAMSSKTPKDTTNKKKPTNEASFHFMIWTIDTFCFVSRVFSRAL